MTVINTNIKSMIAANSLQVNNRAMSKAMNQLSTGQRINSAADDAAGLALSQSMTSQIRGLNMAVRNANDAISYLQTTDGALVEVSNMLQRMRELAVQGAASTSTLNSTQIGFLSDEFNQLATQIDATISNTKWNDTVVLTASALNVQAGANSADAISFTFSGISASFGTGIGSAVGSAGVISTVNSALTTVNTYRAKLGAYINRLTSAADNMTQVSQNLSESRSRILDTDYAQVTTELARTQIIQQAGTAVLAQANQASQAVLSLLR
jgi:flagellin